MQVFGRLISPAQSTNFSHSSPFMPSGYYTNAAKLTPAGVYITCSSGMSVIPHSQSVSGRYGAPPEWVVYQVCLRLSSRACNVCVSAASVCLLCVRLNSNPTNRSCCLYFDSAVAQEAYEGDVATIREVSRISPRWLAQVVPHFYAVQEQVGK